MQIRPTIVDIARELNLHPSTVSRALTGQGRVGQETKDLVFKKAVELGYNCNQVASSLRKGITDTVGIVVPLINRSFFSNVISGAESVLNPAGYNLVVCQTHDRKEDEIRVIRNLLRNQVAGMLVSHSLETTSPELLQRVSTNGVVLVQFDRAFEDLDGTTCVVNDNFYGAYVATKHMIESGYKRIGHLGGEFSSNIYADRLAGYRKALEEAGMEFDETIIYTNSITRDKGFYNMAKALDKGCDALYCAGDYAALGVMEYARHNNIKIPDDFGVVGTANETFAELINPSLTSVEQNARDMGIQAAEAFLAMREDKAPTNKKIVVPMKLIVRESAKR
ncbi:MAG: LacI family DNA-binding transcriptional regulator [Bacteroidia bacterium]|nr:LacI family DNA-binding transcriptional regulator [Bacteroidia bacterium]